MALEKRILVVDDDDAIRMLLYTILRRRGFAVDTARHGREAAERLEKCIYAVMLLDLMMPLMNGWEVLERTAAMPHERRPLIIVLTAGSEPRHLDPGLVAGTLRKPFDIELLLDMIAACVASLAERPQAEGCPPAESSRGRERRIDDVN